ncbi:hypothetical protein [Ekhidna sp.]|uniref:hypothetical protein n=1 Tax=Ekhidna sp. TaxID=2608089 RepID=UPI00329A55E3
MKKLIALLTILIASHCAFSQDLIVTAEGDSIECKITRIGNDFIHFSVYGKSGVLLMRSRLPLTQVQSYQQADPEEKNEKIDPLNKDEELPNKYEDLPVVYEEFLPASFRLSLNTGYTYQLGGYDGLPNSYKKQLQSLWNVGAELSCFISDDVGIGAKYNYIFTRADEDFQPPVSTAFGFSSIRDEKVSFRYVGLLLGFRNFLYDDQIVNYFISGGVIKYRTDGLADGAPFYQEGHTFGAVVGVSYDFLFHRNVGIGVGAEVNIANLREFDNNGNIVPADFSLTRVDLTLGFRFFK